MSIRTFRSFIPTSAFSGTRALCTTAHASPLYRQHNRGKPLQSTPTITTTIPRASNTSLVRAQQTARHLSSSPAPSDSSPNMSYAVRSIGQPHTADYRAYIEKDGVPISAFHDIPLYANDARTELNMIVEIPRWTNAKNEISKSDFLNPIKQDSKNGKPRFVRNCFPHKGYIWNYGAFPRTWEDPNVPDADTTMKGDNDPLDVCEIGEFVGRIGEIKRVKVLGTMALLDDGETDWKVIVIDVNDPLAPKLQDIEDVERHLPGLLRASNEWFRIYKIPDGKPENSFAFTGECKNKKYALDLIQHCHESWDNLINGRADVEDISLENTTLEKNRVETQDVQEMVPADESLPPAPYPNVLDKWFFISAA